MHVSLEKMQYNENSYKLGTSYFCVYSGKQFFRNYCTFVFLM